MQKLHKIITATIDKEIEIGDFTQHVNGSYIYKITDTEIGFISNLDKSHIKAIGFAVLSDDEILINDWVCDLDSGEMFQVGENFINGNQKKIIGSYPILKGLPIISFEFIEKWRVNQPDEIEVMMVQSECVNTYVPIKVYNMDLQVNQLVCSLPKALISNIDIEKEGADNGFYKHCLQHNFIPKPELPKSEILCKYSSVFTCSELCGWNKNPEKYKKPMKKFSIEIELSDKELEFLKSIKWEDKEGVKVMSYTEECNSLQNKGVIVEFYGAYFSDSRLFLTDVGKQILKYIN